MKKILFNRIHFLVLSCLVLVVMQLSSCKDEDQDGPVITAVRNYAPAPNDTLINVLVPGQFVVIEGSNLQEASLITFAGIPATFNKALFSYNYAVVRVPDVIPFPLIAEEDMNKIRYVTPGGETTFNFDIVAGAPMISGIFNENPVEGEIVMIAGTNLFLIEEVNFGGAIITDFEASIDGTRIAFTMPASSASDPLSITTASGTAETIFNVNDLTTGMLCNFDDINNYSWGAGTSNSDPAFPGNHGWYPILDTGILGAGDFSWWGGGRSLNINSVQWVPVEELDQPIANYAVKFEMNIAGEWNGVSLFILKDYNWAYVARFEPWKISETKTTNVNTSGKWMTVTVPLTEFRTKKDNKDGTGDSASSLTQLLGASGAGAIEFFTVNAGSAPTPIGLRAAIDNIRVVKIK
ncbi:glycan-binding surface protein [Gaoshiqia sp. Z1-71]|uniref:glycan-binding surface protein n=1 Tax=Gaoshiqia hydrogeniformans TaxID=3290090 RepID=UPI003BF7E7BC